MTGFLIYFMALSLIHLFFCYFEMRVLRMITKPLILLSLSVFYAFHAPEQTCLQSDNDSPVQKAVSADTLQAVCFLTVSQTYSDCAFPEKQYPPSESLDLAHIRNEL